MAQYAVNGGRTDAQRYYSSKEQQCERHTATDAQRQQLIRKQKQ